MLVCSTEAHAVQPSQQLQYTEVQAWQHAPPGLEALLQGAEAATDQLLIAAGCRHSVAPSHKAELPDQP